MDGRRSRVDVSMWVLAAALVASGCGSTGSNGAEHPDAGFQDASPAADATVASDAGGDPRSLVRIAIALEGAAVLAPGATSTVTATGELADGSRVDLTRAATWRTSSATTAEVFAGGAVQAVAPGVAWIVAERGAITSDPLRLEVKVDAPSNVEMRGVWVTRWMFSTPEDVQAIVDDVADTNLNAIFFQVRGTADAYYPSPLEPWAQRLTGTLGQDPGWDPLAEVLARAHARGIQVHAWLNTFPGWTGTSPPAESAPRHKLLENPEWLCADGGGTPMPLASSGYQFFSPGNPAVRAHIAGVVEDLATRYALDGIHMDFIRYPGPQYSHDAASEAELAAARAVDPALTYEDFARERVTLLVRELQARVRRARPSAALSVASWGIFRNTFGWSSVSQGYADFYQDAHRWAREGLVDALCPMIYWPLTNPKGLRTDFATLADDHLAAVRAGGRAMFAGMSAEYSSEELEREIAYARAIGAEGFVIFDLSQLRTNGHLARLRDGVLAEPAAPPVMPY